MRHLLRFLMFALFLSLIVACSAACSHTKTGPPSVLPPLDIFPPGYLAEANAVTLTFEPSDEKTTGNVYRVVRHVDEEYAQDMATKLGVQGTVQRDDSRDIPVYKVEDENASVSVMAGCVRYTSKGGDVGNVSEMTEDEARQQATSFLSQRGLFPAEAEISKTSRSKDDYLSVDFTNKDVPILFGPFPFIPPFVLSVVFDHQGNLKSLEYCWPVLETIGEYTLLSEREAHQDTISRPAESAPGTTVTITSFVPSYYTSTDKEGTSYVVPVYCAMGTRHRELGEDDTECISVLPALPESQMRRDYPDWAPQ